MKFVFLGFLVIIDLGYLMFLGKVHFPTLSLLIFISYPVFFFPRSPIVYQCCYQYFLGRTVDGCALSQHVRRQKKRAREQPGQRRRLLLRPQISDHARTGCSQKGNSQNLLADSLKIYKQKIFHRY